MYRAARPGAPSFPLPTAGLGLFAGRDGIKQKAKFVTGLAVSY